MKNRRACGLIGCGTVGSGVVRLWREPGHHPGVPLVAVAVRDAGKRRTVDLSGISLTTDARSIVRDPAIGLVIEATGDAELAGTLARECIRRSKSFVTANKELAARLGPDLEARAAAAGVAFRYEAAAGGALPVVALLRLGLSPGAVRGFEGVLNGTCNYILSRLDRGIGFADALQQAKEAGFAELDSRKDTSGRDAADKLVILARQCGVRLDPDALAVTGIDGLAPEDAAFARRRGLALRLVASFRDEGETAIASVAPKLLPRDSFLAQARDEENALLLDAGGVGTLGLVGRGAGSLPTAAAVLADVREIVASGPGRPLVSPRIPAAIRGDDARAVRHYVRVEGPAQAGETLARALDAVGIAIDVLTSSSRSQVQALTAPAETAAVRRVVAAAFGSEALMVAAREPSISRSTDHSAPANRAAAPCSSRAASLIGRQAAAIPAAR
jgi:homoserine dehydrogenase